LSGTVRLTNAQVTSDEGQNGYHNDDLDNGDVYDPQKEQQKWASAQAKFNWQQRQQTGDYETASISSSVAGV